MFINLAGIILGILISSLWIFLPLRRVPENIRLKKRTYVLSIIKGATLCTLVIIILETVWDRVTGIPEGTVSTLAQAAAAAFTRAALLEEGAKYWFVRRAVKKDRPQGRLQYMLLAGTVGMGYGITEKLVMGSAFAMLADAAFSLHTIFQFVSGWYLYEAAAAENTGKKRACSVKAFLVPFAVHGIWDFILMGTTLYITEDISVSAVACLLLLIAAVAGAAVSEVKMAKYLKRL